MAVLLRVLLFLIPFAALFLWLRWRSKRDLSDEIREQEFRKLRIGVLLLVVALLGCGLGLRFFTEQPGNVDGVYVPARVENGKVIPGHYVPKVDPEKKGEPNSEEPLKTPDGE